MHHHKYFEVTTLVNAGIAVLLTGEKGTGKTTLAKDTAEALGLNFYSMSMTRQTTLSHLLGFISVNGVYIQSQLRQAVEFGGLFLLDEIDASDPNVILCLNTIENGYMSFPDGIVELHDDFRLMATSNPQNDHKSYNGRAKLDAATLDRFDVVDIEKDDELEKSLVDFYTYSHIELARKCLKDSNSSTYISMRDTIRFQKRKDLGLDDGFIQKLMSEDRMALEQYEKTKDNMPKVKNISDCVMLTDVWEYVTGKNKTTETETDSIPF